MARLYVGGGYLVALCWFAVSRSLSLSLHLSLSLSEEKHLDLSMVFWGESRISPVKTPWSPELILQKQDYMT